VLAELGRGGMGAVYRARHVETGGEVALKVLLDVRGPEDVARFVREGQAVARLRHPAVVTVHAAGEQRGCPWLAMDLVAGESLRARLDRDGPLDAPTARRLFARLAAALEHAHAHGVLHRDLKPENVIIDLMGEPRLIDFGLAQVSDRSRLTRTGDMLGTPAYMAPEQVLGDLAALGPRTDVYGLGATLFDTLTGRPPFEGNPVVVLERVLKHAPTSPARLRPGVDPELAALCVACLEKDPARRPASAAELGRALAPRRSRRRRGRARRLWLVLPLGVASLVVVAGALTALGPAPLEPGGGLASVVTSMAPPPLATEAAPPREEPLARAEALAASGDRAGAIAALDVALREAPARADLRVRRGVLRFEAGDGQGARDDLEAGLELAPSVAGHVARARLRGAAGAHELAEADALTAVSLDPRSPDARVLRGALLDRARSPSRSGSSGSGCSWRPRTWRACPSS
jgi:tetratricopeptide (TPR) repeat protein